MSPSQSLSRLLSITAAAKLLGLSRHTLRRAITNGELETMRIGTKTIYMQRIDLDRWLESRRRKGNGHG